MIRTILKKCALLIFFLFLAGALSLGAEVVNRFWEDIKEDEIYERRTIVCNIDEIENEPSIIYESDLILLKFKLKDIKKTLNAHIEEVHVKEDLKLKDKLEAIEAEVINYNDFEYSEQRRLDYCFSDLLEDCKFFLKDKRSKETVQEIEAARFTKMRSKRCGYSGKVYLLPSSEVFFSVVYAIY